MNANTAAVDREVAAPATQGDRADVPARGRIGLKRLALLIATGLGTLAVLAYVYHWLTVGRFVESTDDAYVGGDITVIAPKVAGFIEQVAVTDNQKVNAGDLLVKLDDRDYRAALERAEAAAEAQRATLANLEATRRLQLAIIEQTRAGIAAAEAEVKRTRDDEARFRDLSAHAAASMQVYQKAEADFKEALAQEQKSRAAAEAAQRQLDVELHGAARADSGSGRQPECAHGRLRVRRHAVDIHSAGARTLDRCQLQGESARGNARGLARARQGGCSTGS